MSKVTVQIPFIGGHYEDDSPNIDAQQCINFYLEPDDEGGRPALVGTPGLEQFVNLAT